MHRRVAADDDHFLKYFAPVVAADRGLFARFDISWRKEQKQREHETG
jgi:hypothetical protein